MEQIKELKDEMEQCRKGFEKRIAELKKPEWKNPMDVKESGQYWYINYDGHPTKGDPPLMECRKDFGNVFSSPEFAKQTGDEIKLFLLMKRDALESWQGESIDYTDQTPKWMFWKNGLTKEIKVAHFSKVKESSYPFKTLEELCNSIDRHRKLFDRVFGSFGYVFKQELD